MLLASPSGGGKTNLYHMLTQPLVYFDQIHLYGKNLEQAKYQQLREKFDLTQWYMKFDDNNIKLDIKKSN